MKKLCLFVTLLLITAIGFTQNVTFDAGIGIMHGKNRLIHPDPIPVPHPTYELYRDSFHYVSKTTASVFVSAGYIFRKNDKEFIEVQSGFIAGADIGTSPVFGFLRGTLYAINTEYFAAGPYIGGAFRIRNVEQRDYGFHMTKGMQFIFWNYGKKTGKNATFINVDHTYKHVSINAGMKFLF